MNALRAVLIVLAFLLLAAHFSRAGHDLASLAAVLFPILLLVRRRWARWTLRVALVLGGFEWLRTLFRLVGERRALGEDWTRLALILGVVALLTFGAAKAVRLGVEPERREAGT